MSGNVVVGYRSGTAVTDRAIDVTAATPLPVTGTLVPGTPVVPTGTNANVNDTNADTTILAANANRRGATIWNDSTAILYLLLASGTASATNASLSIPAGGYYEVPFGYTGIIKGIWASDASGAARVTEFT